MTHKLITSYLTAFFILLSSLYSKGSTVNDIFTKANKEYHDKDYQQAIADYLKITAQNYQSADLYFNLGNCYYKTDSIGKAILYYEKAKRLSPSDKDIAFNLQLANVKVQDKIEPVNEFILISVWHNVVRSLSADIWAMWAIILLWIGLAALLLFFFGNSLLLRKTGFFAGILLTSFSLLFLIITFSKYQYDSTTKFGVVLLSAVHVMSEPDTQSKELFVLHEGVKVKIISNQDNYYNVELPDGKQGWLDENDLGEI